MTEKKEIGMEKLIELLNEYEKEVKKSEFYEWEKGIGGPNNLFRRDTRDEEGSHIYSDTADTYVISKKYGFIGWLVENDKIDFSLIPNKIKEIGIPMKINGEIKYGFDSSDYYWLLMLLSISDTPIEDLISYLR